MVYPATVGQKRELTRSIEEWCQGRGGRVLPSTDDAATVFVEVELQGDADAVEFKLRFSDDLMRKAPFETTEDKLARFLSHEINQEILLTLTKHIKFPE